MLTLEDLRVIEAPVERCFDLARSVEVHLAGNIHCGEPALAVGGVTSGLLDLDREVTWRARHFGVRHLLTSRVAAMERPIYFQGAMVRGPFGFMRHYHFFRALSPHQTEMQDRLFVKAPLGLLGSLAELVFLRRYMQALLEERNLVIQQIAESCRWQEYLPSADRGRHAAP
jgi:ligand-binding SRPBCC domain-containing protein